MNKEELHKLNVILFDNLDIETYSKTMEYLTNIIKENKQLKDNWNKLKENIKRRKEKFDSGLWCELDVMRMFNYLMQELENGDSNE